MSVCNCPSHVSVRVVAGDLDKRAENIRSIIQRIKVQVPPEKQRAKPRSLTKRPSDDDVIIVEPPKLPATPSPPSSADTSQKLLCFDCGVLLTSRHSVAKCTTCSRTCRGRLQLKLHAKKHFPVLPRFRCSACVGSAKLDAGCESEQSRKCSGCGHEQKDEDAWLEHVVGCQYATNGRSSTVHCRVRLKPTPALACILIFVL